MRHSNGKALVAITAAVLLLAAAACEGGGVRDPAFGMMDSPVSPTLSSIQSSVFSTSCAFVGCHAGAAPAAGMDLSPGGQMQGVPHTQGTREYLTCETGSIQLSAGGEVWALGPGDVVVFPGDQRHAYRNLSRGRTVAYSIVALAPVGR